MYVTEKHTSRLYDLSRVRFSNIGNIPECMVSAPVSGRLEDGEGIRMLKISYSKFKEQEYNLYKNFSRFGTYEMI